MKPKHFLMPLVPPFAVTCLLLIMSAIAYSLSNYENPLVGFLALLAFAAPMLWTIFSCAIIGYPIFSYKYGKSIATLSRVKYLLAVLNSLVAAVFSFFHLNLTFALFVFVWCLIWTMLPILIYRNPKEKEEKDGDQPSI